jgi:glyoxylase-like metal-dependent hydrolase (beta-lactamase superfamily II)
MEITQIAPELWYWTAPHPAWRSGADWPEEVGCVYYETPDAVALIDPLVPRGDEKDFWAFLDDHVSRAAVPVRVLLTAPWHERSAPTVAERYGTSVWLHGSDTPLPVGVEAFVPGGSDEGQVGFFLRPHRTLVVAEFLLGVDGALQVMPSPAMTDAAAFEKSLRTLLDLPIDHVLVSHGPPVLGDAKRKIEEALLANA